MPSPLAASRAFASHALAALRAGQSRYDKAMEEPGPDFKVEPFAAGSVTKPAALLKLGTSIAAARRAEANYREKERDAALKREEARAQIAQIRARGQYYESQAEAPEMTPYQRESLKLRERSIQATEARDVATQENRQQTQDRLASTTGRLAATKFALSQLDDYEKASLAKREESELALMDTLLGAARGKKDALAKLQRNRFPISSAEDALNALGITKDMLTDPNQAKHLAFALQTHLDRFKQRAMNDIQSRTAATRGKHQRVIMELEQLIQGQNAAAATPETPAPEENIDDALGILTP